ncbi:uncharacterized protein ACWYII_044889 isoform 1-T1 [Salvelinus alpinus]
MKCLWAFFSCFLSRASCGTQELDGQSQTGIPIHATHQDQMIWTRLSNRCKEPMGVLESFHLSTSMCAGAVCFPRARLRLPSQQNPCKGLLYRPANSDNATFSFQLDSYEAMNLQHQNTLLNKMAGLA